MNILFVNPNLYKLGNQKIKLSIYDTFLDRFNFHPNNFNYSLSFPILAALTPQEHNVYFIDELNNKSMVDFNQSYDLVGISCIRTCSVLRAYEIADEFRRRGVKVVLGGYHVSALPDEAKQHADGVVIGEAESTWPQLLNDFEKGNLKSFYVQEKPVDLSALPIPRRDILKSDRYGKVEATRGCPVGCEFCTISNQKFGCVFRTRPIEKVIAEIKSLKAKYLFMFDSSLTTNANYSKQLFREMIGLNKRFNCFGNIDMLGKDEELLHLASEAGCYGWFVGFESISQQCLNNINKKTNKVNEYIQAIKKVHDYGMIIFGCFIFGFDTDTKDTFDATADFVHRSDIDVPWYNVLTPFPGTPLYFKLENEGRILTKNWSKYDFLHAVFQPKNMTPKELEDGTYYTNKKTSSILNILRRMYNNVNLDFDQFKEKFSKNIVLYNQFKT